jgi:hypothetical protein
MELNTIQFKLHAMLFNIFIQIEHNFHKINSFFSINWLSFVVQSNVKSKLIIPMMMIHWS